jgi:hypothetical protein
VQRLVRLALQACLPDQRAQALAVEVGMRSDQFGKRGIAFAQQAFAQGFQVMRRRGLACAGFAIVGQ